MDDSAAIKAASAAAPEELPGVTLNASPAPLPEPTENFNAACVRAPNQ